MHECGHYTFFRNRSANVLVGYIASAFAILPFETRRKEHWGHHIWNGTFKEPTTERSIKAFDRPGDLRFLNTLWKLWVPAFAMNEHFRVNLKANMVERLIVAIPFLAAVYFFSWKLILPFYIYMVILELINIAHHVDSPIHSSDKPIPFRDQGAYTYSCYQIPFVSSVLGLNFNNHTAHHLDPMIPWYDLPEAESKIDSVKHNEFIWHWNARRQHATKVYGKYRGHNV